ncbi:mucin-2 isoform X1 [Folsomia candida]|uniref:mucin-2 isoform X1 n=1 Tax=Folsomia candida TaxID=158441 RepID=UPI000B8FE59E|nr:mucin-2 isoform X1 [Folsomia candida]
MFYELKILICGVLFVIPHSAQARYFYHDVDNSYYPIFRGGNRGGNPYGGGGGDGDDAFECARIHDQPNYQGRSSDFKDGDKLHNFGWYNNIKPQSVRVKSSCALTVYDYFWNRRTFKDDSHWIWGVMKKWNYPVTAACCECGGCEGPSAHKDLQCARLYEHERCNGCDGYRLDLKSGDKVRNFGHLDNRMSSIVVRPGCYVISYYDANYQGYRVNFTNSINLFGDNWNKHVSSVECHCPHQDPYPTAAPTWPTYPTAAPTQPHWTYPTAIPLPTWPTYPTAAPTWPTYPTAAPTWDPYPTWPTYYPDHTVTIEPWLTDPPVATIEPWLTDPPVATIEPWLTDPPVATIEPWLTDPPVATIEPWLTNPPATIEPWLTDPPATIEPWLTNPPATIEPWLTDPPATIEPWLTNPPATIEPWLTDPPEITVTLPVVTKPAVTVTMPVITEAPVTAPTTSDWGDYPDPIATNPPSSEEDQDPFLSSEEEDENGNGRDKEEETGNGHDKEEETDPFPETGGGGSDDKTEDNKPDDKGDEDDSDDDDDGWGDDDSDEEETTTMKAMTTTTTKMTTTTTTTTTPAPTTKKITTTTTTEAPDDDEDKGDDWGADDW